jgi:hypothetical protein
MTLYKKQGRRYIPVQDTEAYNGLENGCWLVKVEKGSTAYRQTKEPAMAALQFATLIATNKIVKYLSQVSEARPSTRQHTKKQLKAFKVMKEILGEEDKFFYWEYESLHGMAEKIVDLIMENYHDSKI